MKTSDAMRGEKVKSRLKLGSRHCEEQSDEAIHSFFLRFDGLLRFARNDAVRDDFAFPRHDAPEFCMNFPPLENRATVLEVDRRSAGLKAGAGAPPPLAADGLDPVRSPVCWAYHALGR